MASGGSPKKMNPRKLARKATQEIAGIAMTWLGNVDTIRIKSRRMQGPLSGEMKWRVKLLKEAVKILADRTEAAGDSD